MTGRMTGRVDVSTRPWVPRQWGAVAAADQLVAPSQRMIQIDLFILHQLRLFVARVRWAALTACTGVVCSILGELEGADDCCVGWRESGGGATCAGSQAVYA